MEQRLAEVRDYLSAARDYKNSIDRKQEQILELEQLAKRSTIVLSDTNKKTSERNRRMENAILKVITLRNELMDMLVSYSDAYMEITNAIESLENPKYREVLELRYLNFKTWMQVADIIEKTHYHVTHRLHPAALEALSQRVHRKNKQSFSA